MSDTPETAGGAVNVPGITDSSDIDVSKVADGMLNKFLGDSGLFDMVKDWGDKHPDEFRAKLSEWKNDVTDFIDADGKIKLEELKSKLTITEAMCLLIGGFISTNVLPSFFSKNREYKKMSYQDTIDYFKAKKEAGKSGALLDGLDGHIVWPGVGPFGEITALLENFSLLNERKETFPLPVGTRIIMPSSGSGEGPRLAPTKFTMLKEYSKSLGITLTRLEPGEVQLTAPDKNGIQYIGVPNGLPLSSDGKIDMEKLNWYAKVWDDTDVHGQWVSVSPLVAAILYLRGEGKIDAQVALTKAGATINEDIVKFIQSIPLPGQTNEPVAAPEAPASEPPAEPETPTQ